ncbi:MAG: serine/threonine protein kinase [Gammaproteobacteria bacterium]|nr:serine/threonine protein kinase [Gammaproteobacteria bacterium]MBI5618697.1 serine/threonine protein kinase [Gammaproteobacteria bacterium]
MSGALPAADAPYATLTPDRVLAAIESCGYECNGRLLALNSYENRVYRVGVGETDNVIAKFYRPGRFSDAAIGEEHAFAAELLEREIPIVAPLAIDGRTLHHDAELRFALYPNRPGRAPELEDHDTLRWLGRFIGRIHAVGSTRKFTHRPELSIARLGAEPSQFLLGSEFIPGELKRVYESVIDDALVRIRACFDRAGPYRALRLHGDCHPGNIMWTPAGPHFVDLDDCMTGPAIQDLWMLLVGEHHERAGQLAVVLEGYEDFAEFDYAELPLIEALRTLRMIHYAAWLARRWNDPAFPLHFPWFNSQRYWQDHILALREQLAAMDEAAPALGGGQGGYPGDDDDYEFYDR